ncbi:MAG: hypothetical protein NTW25_07440 [Candidatus Kapabacteria bacterium]|nr:hypothetical protein [Candidatus Kapabacteria bacterium]
MQYNKIKKAILLLSTAGMTVAGTSCSDNSVSTNKDKKVDVIKPYTQGQLLTDAALQDYLTSIGMNVSALQSLKTNINSSVLSAMQSRFTVDSLRSAMIVLNVESHKSEFVSLLDTIIAQHQIHNIPNHDYVSNVTFEVFGSTPNVIIKGNSIATDNTTIKTSVEVTKDAAGGTTVKGTVSAEVKFSCC